MDFGLLTLYAGRFSAAMSNSPLSAGQTGRVAFFRQILPKIINIAARENEHAHMTGSFLLLLGTL